MPEHRDTPGTAMPDDESDAEERPPLGGWPRLYALVLGELVLLVLLFTLFAYAFR